MKNTIRIERLQVGDEVELEGISFETEMSADEYGKIANELSSAIARVILALDRCLASTNHRSHDAEEVYALLQQAAQHASHYND